MEQGDMALATDTIQDDEDLEDDEVKPTDSMIITAITEDDYSHLEIQLYSNDGTLFVHHDINLPEFPLCLAWMDCPPFLVDGQQQMIGVITFGCVYIVLYYLCVYTDSMYISLYLLRSIMPCITHIHIHILIYIVLTHLYTIYNR